MRERRRERMDIGRISSSGEEREEKGGKEKKVKPGGNWGKQKRKGIEKGK